MFDITAVLIVMRKYPKSGYMTKIFQVHWWSYTSPIKPKLFQMCDKNMQRAII